MKLGALLAGVGVGFAVTVLVAPRSGEETRQKISEKFGKGKEFVNEKMEEVTFRVAAAADEAVERIVIQEINASPTANVDFPGAEEAAS